MRVDGTVPGSSYKAVVLCIWDMTVGIRVPELLRETKVNDADMITACSFTQKEMLRLNVAMDEVVSMYSLQLCDLEYQILLVSIGVIL
jgi:hypothetical protein